MLITIAVFSIFLIIFLMMIEKGSEKSALALENDAKEGKKSILNITIALCYLTINCALLIGLIYFVYLFLK